MPHKNQSLENISQAQINIVVEELNNRPRKTLGYKTPKEVFCQYNIYQKSNPCT